MRAYWKRVGWDRKNHPITSEEDRKARVAARSAKRQERIKQATPTWDEELTDFVYQEALHLTQLRNKVTPFKWQVDHIIPLKGKTVCGLHTWNNFQLLPDFVNLEKRNKYEEKELAVHEERETGLSGGGEVGEDEIDFETIGASPEDEGSEEDGEGGFSLKR